MRPFRSACMLMVIQVIIAFGAMSQQDTIADKGLHYPLKIGDTVPDLVFDKILNFSGREKVRISDFKGQLLILDFWTVFCSSCIKEFPRLQQLNTKYKGKVSIISVGFDGYMHGSIKRYVDQKKGTSGQVDIPVIIQGMNQKILEELFPFTSVPHEVWIDPSGTLVGITDANAVADKNILKVLNGGDLSNVRKKRYNRLTYNDDFLFVKNRSGHTYPFYESVFSGYIDSLLANHSQSSFDIQSDSFYYRFFDINNYIINYYRKAYVNDLPELKKPGNKRVIVESSKRSFPGMQMSHLPFMDNYQRDSFNRRNLFCYELVLPKSGFTLEEAREIFRADLDRYFQLSSRLEERTIKSFSLVKLKTFPNKIVDTEFKKIRNLSGTEADSLHMLKDENIGYLIDYLNRYLLESDFPVFDSTGYPGKINMILPARPVSYPEVRSLLRKYGFDLIESTRALKVLVIRDRD